MTDELFLKDCYMKEFDAVVESVKDGKYVVLDRTAFYPNAGGQPHDTGRLVRESDGKEFMVLYAGRFGGKISHEVSEPGLAEKDRVKGIIDWERRYTLMRMHTAAHVLSRVIFEETGAHTSGNQLGTDKSRIDFTLDQFDKEKIPCWFEKANRLISESHPVRKAFMEREDALKIEGFAGPSPHLMKHFETLRVVDIEGVDVQPCGGTHLDSLSEIGKLLFVKAENKGKSNRRIYYSLA